MYLLILILLIPTSDGHGSKAPAVIQQAFKVKDFRFENDANLQCNKIKTQLEPAYGNQVVSSKCVRSW